MAMVLKIRITFYSILFYIRAHGPNRGKFGKPILTLTAAPARPARAGHAVHPRQQHQHRAGMIVGDDVEDAAGVAPAEITDAAQPTDAKNTLLRKYYCADTKCGCCCCCLCWAPLVLFLFFFLSAAAQTFPATQFTNVKYSNVDGVTLHGYLATPTAAAAKSGPDGKIPAALVFHAWNGMSEEAVFFADRLAAEGYYALAPDLFRNTAAKGMNILWNMVNVIGTPQSRMDKDSDAALTYLRSLSEVDTDKIISGPGFGNSEIESTYVDENLNRRKRGLVQVQRFECCQNNEKKNYKVADFDLQHFLKFSAKVCGKFRIKKKTLEIVEIGCNNHR
jgi:hypothetical protein